MYVVEEGETERMDKPKQERGRRWTNPFSSSSSVNSAHRTSTCRFFSCSRMPWSGWRCLGKSSIDPKLDPVPNCPPGGPSRGRNDDRFFTTEGRGREVRKEGQLVSTREKRRREGRWKRDAPYPLVPLRMGDGQVRAWSVMGRGDGREGRWRG